MKPLHTPNSTSNPLRPDTQQFFLEAAAYPTGLEEANRIADSMRTLLGELDTISQLLVVEDDDVALIILLRLANDDTELSTPLDWGDHLPVTLGSEFQAELIELFSDYLNGLVLVSSSGQEFSLFG